MEENISVVIFTYNEEANIQRSIRSAKLITDNILVIDLESTDKTRSLAQQLGAKVTEHKHVDYVEPVRRFGIDQAVSDWVLVLDTDEKVSPELAEEIKSAIQKSQFSYYKIPRRNIFGNPPTGGWLKYGGWWPDYQPRLINKKYFVDWPKEIHSTPKIKGESGRLKQPLEHSFHGDLEVMVGKTAVFEDIESNLLLEANKSASTIIFFRKFIGEFWRRFIKNLGFLDGTVGIIESIYQAFSKTITYLFLYEKKLKNRSL